MAESTNRVILKIDFEGNNAIQQTAALRKAFEELKGQREQLIQKVKEGNALTEKERVQLEILNAQLKENQRETRTVTKFIDDNLKARKAETGSIEANRAKLSQLTAEYIKTGKPTQQMTKDIKDLSDKLKSQEKAIGDNRRNVGAYAESLAGIGGPIGGAINGVKGFNTALAANPIGAILALIIPLIQNLIKLKPVADFLEAAFAGLAAGFDAFIGSMGKFFSGDFSGAFADFSTKVGDAVKNAHDLARALQDVADSERQVATIISTARTEIDKLLIQSKNRTISEEERIKLLEKASKLEEDSLKLETDNAKERLRIQIEKNKEILKTRQLTDEEDQARVDAQLKLDDLQRASLVLQEKIQNRKDALQDAADKKAEESLEKRKKELEDTLAEQRAFIQKAEDNLFKDEQEREKKRKEAKEKSDKEEIDRIIAQGEAEAFVIVEQRKKRLQAEQEFATAEFNLQKAKFDAIQGLIDLSQAAAGENATIQAVLFALEKAVAISELIVNLQRERSLNAVAGASMNAIVPGSGVAFTAIQNTQAAIRAFTGIAAITAQAIPQIKKQFYDGGEYGYTGDGNPTEESTNLGVKPYVYHKKEYIVPDKILSTPIGSRLVGMLEAMRKSTPSPLAYLGGYADGGFTQRALAEGVNNRIDQANAFRNLPTPIVRVSEINRVNENMETAINVSDL